MGLLELLSPEIVKVPIASQTKQEIIGELIQVLEDAGKLTDVEKAHDAVLAREDMGSTGLEMGIAVPHAKTDAVKELTMSLGIASAGVDFESIDGQPSHLFFLILAPPDQSGPHIELLAEIARITRSQSFYKLVIGATSADQVVGLFKEE